MTYREVGRKLRQLGCQEISRRSGGSHRKWMNPATGQATTVPDWGAKDLKLGTMRAIVRQLGLDWQAFESA
jgi:mRNA interferase HicA